MPVFKPKNSDYLTIKHEEKNRKLLKKEVYDSFGLHLLDLGDITKKSDLTDAVAAVFDLQGFTRFCNQTDPQFSLPEFLSAFLEWLFEIIRQEHTTKVHPEGVQLFSPLPFYAKFMGDGVLMLWDVADANTVQIRNIVHSCKLICDKYITTFYEEIAGRVSYPPRVLRCGVARGNVFTVGDGNDYVGSCINLAARIQKTPGASFAFCPRGMHLHESIASDFFKKSIVVKKMSIRGIGDGELIAVLKKEYDAMGEEDQKLLLAPNH